MKKIQLKALDLGATEILTREQLKNTIGGDGRYACSCKNGTGTWTAIYTDQSHADAWAKYNCTNQGGGTCVLITTTEPEEPPVF